MPLTITRRKLMMVMSIDLSCRGVRDKVVRLVSVNPETMQQLPVIAAEEMKYFRQQSVEVQVESLPSSARAMQALLGGTADVVSTLFDQLILMAATVEQYAFWLKGMRWTLRIGGVEFCPFPVNPG